MTFMNENIFAVINPHQPKTEMVTFSPFFYQSFIKTTTNEQKTELMCLGGGAGKMTNSISLIKLIRKTRRRTIIQEGFGTELTENSGIQKREMWCLG